MSDQPRYRLGYYEDIMWSEWDDYVDAGNGHGSLDATWVWTDVYLPDSYEEPGNYEGVDVSKSVPLGVVWAIVRDTEKRTDGCG